MSTVSSCDDDFLDRLPDDIWQFRILIKLPVKDLIQLISLSRQFKILIRNSKFLEAHLSSIEEIHPRYLLSYSDGELRIYSSPNYSFKSIQAPVPQDFELVGNSARGVLCFGPDPSEYESADLILWNPSILKSTNVPNTPINFKPHVFYGFGFDHVVKVDFKVVQISYNNPVVEHEMFDNPEAMVYGVKTGCWRSLGSNVPCYVLYGRSSVSVNGIVYWLAWHKATDGDGKRFACVMGFDLASEVFKVLELPPDYHPTNKWNSDVLRIRLSTSSDGKSLVVFFSGKLVSVNSQFSKNWSVWYYIQDSHWMKQYDLVIDRQDYYYCCCSPLYIVDDDHGVVLAELQDGRKCLVNRLKEGEDVSAMRLLDQGISACNKLSVEYTGYTPTLEFLLHYTEQEESPRKGTEIQELF